MARWASIEKVAEYTGYSASTLRNKIFAKEEMGKLFYKVGGLRRADLDEIDAFVKGGQK
tara:strand:+ start:142 stop:318 length:177 start_codon:yes stop_codon:yes gene_type:complete